MTAPGNLRLETLTSAELTPEKIREISDFFRYTFNNDWPEFLVCTNCDSLPESKRPEDAKISAAEAFRRAGLISPEEKGPISLEDMDGFATPLDCEHCSSRMEIFHDPGRVSELKTGRLSREGYASLLRNTDSGQLEGICYGFGCPLGQQFESEWANIYTYMAKQDPKHARSLDRLIACLNEVCPEAGFSSETKVFAWNTVAISNSLRKTGKMREMVGAYFDIIPPEYLHLYSIGEVLDGSKWQQLLKKAQGKMVPGFLGGGELLSCGVLQNYADAFRLPPEEFAQIGK